MGNITTILSTIQKNLKAPKNQFNKFGGYNYRSCEDILEALKPITADLGAAVTIEDEIVFIGNRFYVKATATLHFEAETLSVSAYAREAETKKGMDESQITGATSSYARKYALNGLFAIDDNKDADSTNTHGKDEKPSTAPSKANDNGMGNLAPAPAAKPQAKPQTVTEPVESKPAYAEGKNPYLIDDAWNWDGTYGSYKGYPLKILYQSNPKNLNDVYVLAKEANDTNLLQAIKTIAQTASAAK